jgi:hypothetical protein
LLLAAAAFLGWLCLALQPRLGLPVSSAHFHRTDRLSLKSPVFQNRIRHWPENTLFRPMSFCGWRMTGDIYDQIQSVTARACTRAGQVADLQLLNW